MKITSDKIIFSGEDWVDGLNNQYNSSALIDGNVIASAASMNPYRPNGIAGPGYLANDTTNMTTVTGKVVGGINKFGNLTKGILICDDGTIQELTYSTNTITNGGGTFPYTINHAHNNEVGEDIVAYSVGSIRYAFYSFRDATDWDIGRYDYATTFDDDYMSTVHASPLAAPYITGGKDAPHPMIVGTDDLLYVGDRNFLHGFDGQTGANGTFYAAVLTLPSGYIITSFAKDENFLIIYAYRQNQTDSDGSTTGQATAFFWDYLALDPVKIIDIEDNYVNGGFSYRGIPCCFTTGRPTEQWLGSSLNKRSDLRMFDGTGFRSVVSFDGTIPIYRGVDVVSDEIMWNSNGAIFSWAEKIKGKGFKLNKTASMTSGSASGFLKTMTSTQQYASAGAGASGGLQYFSFTSYASNANLSTIYVQPPILERHIYRLKAVEVYLYSTGSSTNNLILNVNYLGGSSGQQTIFTEDVFSQNVVRFETDSSGAAFLPFYRIGIQLAWSLSDTSSTPARVDTVILYYEPINIL